MLFMVCAVLNLLVFVSQGATSAKREFDSKSRNFDNQHTTR